MQILLGVCKIGYDSAQKTKCNFFGERQKKSEKNSERENKKLSTFSDYFCYFLAEYV